MNTFIKHKTNLTVILIFIMSMLLFSSAMWAKLRETRLGENAYARAAYDTAIKHFTNAINAGEPRGEPHFFIGNILETRRQFKASIPYFESAVERPLPWTYKKAALWKLVIFHRKEKNYEKALKYVNRLEKSGVHHATLSKVRREADLFLTPEKKEARELMKKALTREKELKDNAPPREEKQARKKYWEDNKSNLVEIAEMMVKAYRLDNELKNYLWKAALYFEKTRDFIKAENTYREIADSDDTGRAQYKIGLLKKRMKEYEKSLDHFRQALKQGEKNKTMQYYIFVNLGQSYYALNNRQSMKWQGAAAIKLKQHRVSSSGTILPELIYCMSFFEDEAEKMKSSKGLPETCEKIGKTAAGSLNAPASDRSLLEWYKARFYQYQFMTKGQVQDKQKAIEHYRACLLPPEKEEIDLISDDEDLEEDTTAKFKPLPAWVRSHISAAIDFFRITEEHELLGQVLQQYREILKDEENYTLWQADIFFHNKEYREAARLYETMQSRAYSVQKRYFISLAMTDDWPTFKAQLEAYLIENTRLIKTVLGVIEKDAEYESFRNKPDYQSVVDRLKQLDTRADDS